VQVWQQNPCVVQGVLICRRGQLWSDFCHLDFYRPGFCHLGYSHHVYLNHGCGYRPCLMYVQHCAGLVCHARHLGCARVCSHPGCCFLHSPYSAQLRHDARYVRDHPPERAYRGQACRPYVKHEAHALAAPLGRWGYRLWV